MFTWAAHLAEDLWYGRCGVGAAARCSAQQRIRHRAGMCALAAVGLRLQIGRRLHVATAERAAGAGSGPGPRCEGCRFREELDRAAGSSPQQAPSQDRGGAEKCHYWVAGRRRGLFWGPQSGCLCAVFYSW